MFGFLLVPYSVSAFSRDWKEARAMPSRPAEADCSGQGAGELFSVECDEKRFCGLLLGEGAGEKHTQMC